MAASGQPADRPPSGAAAFPLPETYVHWQKAARRLLEPLAALMQPGTAALPIRGRASDHDAQADRLESFARPLWLTALYLQTHDGSGSAGTMRDAGLPAQALAGESAFRQRISEWFRAGLVAGTDPASPEYWGPDANYHQHHVEMGLMAVALQVAENDLWAPLPAAAREQIARWFATSRGGGSVNNNHLFMSVHILEFLGTHGYGRRSDRAIITTHLDQLEMMHRGGGWFEDGINQAFDYYNAYAFHFYGLMWCRLHGRRDTVRAERWREWARLFVRDYQHFFAASGEFPAFGRSITYRLNGLNVFGLALAENCTELAPGMLRRLCTHCLDFFLTRPVYQEQGCLAPGFTDRFDRIVEPYSAPASPYWAAKGLAPLLLPPEHRFWSAPEEPLPAERPGGFVHVMPTPRIVVRSLHGGQVELLNGGSMVGHTQLRYGAWKWSKLAYRTGVQFTYAFPELTEWSPDGALTQQIADGRVFGRHSTMAIEIDDQHLGYSYNLGAKAGQVNTGVETFVFWRGGWLLQVHRVEPCQPVILRLGGFALPLARAGAAPPPAMPAPPPAVHGVAPALSYFGADGLGTVLQPVAGLTAGDWDIRLDERGERRHVSAPWHVTPIAKTERLSKAVTLAALAWAGRGRAESAPWHVIFGTAGQWSLSHPMLGSWDLEHWALPLLA